MTTVVVASKKRTAKGILEVRKTKDGTESLAEAMKQIQDFESAQIEGSQKIFAELKKRRAAALEKYPELKGLI